MPARVKVVARLRPVSCAQDPNAELDVQGGAGVIRLSRVRPRSRNGPEVSEFKFDGVLENATQAEVYDRTASSITESVVQGYNGTILAYGQTGAGKTFTVTGSTQTYANRGLCARAISHMFEATRRPSLDAEFIVRVSYLELYNEVLHDLLAPGDAVDDGQALAVQESRSGVTHIKGLRMPVAHTEEEALNLLFEGETNRAIAEHQLNAASTRSHCIFTLYLRAEPRDPELQAVTSKLHLVDLAGSERLSKTQSTGEVQKEASFINKSLTLLEQVVIALAEKRRGHVPYRSSKLTNILKDSLGGNCNTLVIACLWPDPSHVDQSLSTLKFAARMMRIRNEPVVNVPVDKSASLRRAEAEIELLRRELALRDMVAGGHAPTVDHRPLTEAQRRALRGVVERFVADPEQPVEFMSVRQAQETFGVMRSMICEARLAGPAASSLPSSSSSPRARPDSAASSLSAASSAAPSREASPSPTPRDQPPARAPLPELAPEEMEQLFSEFKQADGREAEASLSAAKAELKAAKRRSKALVAEVNGCKREIDVLVLSTAESGGGDEGDEGEDRDEVFARLKAAKAAYRRKHDELGECKAQVQYAQRAKEQCFKQLVAAFQAWRSSSLPSPSPFSSATPAPAPAPSVAVAVAVPSPLASPKGPPIAADASSQAAYQQAQFMAATRQSSRTNERVRDRKREAGTFGR